MTIYKTIRMSHYEFSDLFGVSYSNACYFVEGYLHTRAIHERGDFNVSEQDVLKHVREVLCKKFNISPNTLFIYQPNVDVVVIKGEENTK